jgi:hypothetical protein
VIAINFHVRFHPPFFAPNRHTHENSKPDIIFSAEVAPSDIWITRTLYAEAPEGACEFLNSENDTPKIVRRRKLTAAGGGSHTRRAAAVIKEGFNFG